MYHFYGWENTKPEIRKLYNQLSGIWDEALDYTQNPEQHRKDHFAKQGALLLKE